MKNPSKLLFVHEFDASLISDCRITDNIETFFHSISPLKKKLICSFKVLKSLYMFHAQKQYDYIVVDSDQLLALFIILMAVFKKKKIIYLELLVPIPSLKNFIKTNFLMKIFFPYCVKAIQCMSINDLEIYRRWFKNRIGLSYIPFARIENSLSRKSLELSEPPIILASGYNSVDWELLFKAGQGQKWNLIVVCSNEDYNKLIKLKRENDLTAEIHCQIPWEDHQKLLEKADIYALPVIERKSSVGHIRIMKAVSTGVPVVATRVKGLEEYLIDKVSGMLSPPGDYLLFRKNINTLIGNSGLRQSLVINAKKEACGYTMEKYRESLRNFILSNT